MNGANVSISTYYVTRWRDDKNAELYEKLYKEWSNIRPYRRGHDVKPGQSYADYRTEKFDQFMEQALREVSKEARRDWVQSVRRAKRQDLHLYQKQMSILAYLESGRYSESRQPISLQSAQIGIIYKGQYYFIPVCQPQGPVSNEVTAVRAYVNAIVEQADAADSVSPNLKALGSHQKGLISDVRKRCGRKLCKS